MVSFSSKVTIRYSQWQSHLWSWLGTAKPQSSSQLAQLFACLTTEAICNQAREKAMMTMRVSEWGGKEGELEFRLGRHTLPLGPRLSNEPQHQHQVLDDHHYDDWLSCRQINGLNRKLTSLVTIGRIYQFWQHGLEVLTWNRSRDKKTEPQTLLKGFLSVTPE